MRTIFNTILLDGALALCSCDKDDDTYTELPGRSKCRKISARFWTK